MRSRIRARLSAIVDRASGIFAILARGWNRFVELTSGQSDIFDFAEEAVSDVVDKAADRNLISNPGMRPELLQLVADIFVDVLEGVEKSRRDRSGSGAILN